MKKYDQFSSDHSVPDKNIKVEPIFENRLVTSSASNSFINVSEIWYNDFIELIETSQKEAQRNKEFAFSITFFKKVL